MARLRLLVIFEALPVECTCLSDMMTGTLGYETSEWLRNRAGVQYRLRCMFEPGPLVSRFHVRNRTLRRREWLLLSLYCWHHLRLGDSSTTVVSLQISVEGAMAVETYTNADYSNRVGVFGLGPLVAD